MAGIKKKDKEQLEKLRSLVVDKLIDLLETGKAKSSDLSSAASVLRNAGLSERNNKPAKVKPVATGGLHAEGLPSASEQSPETAAATSWEPLRVKEELNLPFPAVPSEGSDPE